VAIDDSVVLLSEEDIFPSAKKVKDHTHAHKEIRLPGLAFITTYSGPHHAKGAPEVVGHGESYFLIRPQQ
jgi:hypothetical protein